MGEYGTPKQWEKRMENMRKKERKRAAYLSTETKHKERKTCIAYAVATKKQATQDSGENENAIHSPFIK